MTVATETTDNRPAEDATDGSPAPATAGTYTYNDTIDDRGFYRRESSDGLMFFSTYDVVALSCKNTLLSIRFRDGGGTELNYHDGATALRMAKAVVERIEHYHETVQQKTTNRDSAMAAQVALTANLLKTLT